MLREGRRVLGCVFILNVAVLSFGAVEREEGPPVAAIRAWLAGSHPEGSTRAGPWGQYLKLEGLREADREAGLRRLLDSNPPESLKRVLLIDLQSDLRFQSAQAQFIRRYGFYSNWFNRTFYVASRAVQGNIAAFGQLAVDAVFDFSGRAKASASERRLYKLLGDLRAEGRTTRQDRERLRELRAKIARAQAEMDLELAQWALRSGQPELARFYAEGSGEGSALRQAGKIVRQAEEEIARRARGAVASSQAGFPDREPPVDLHSPKLLRAALQGRIEHFAVNALLIPSDIEVPPDGRPDAGRILITSTTKPFTGEVPGGAEIQRIQTENFVLAWMLTTMDPGTDPVTAMRRWARVIEKMGVEVRRTEWVRTSLDTPAFNPELRMLEAQTSRRASLARFIFLGPETGRERAYIASSRIAQTWNALASVGVFYVFEVFYRAGVAALKPPVPADEVFDAQAAFLRAAPGNPDARRIAESLADQYLRAGRPENAEAVLAAYGGVDQPRAAEIARLRAAALLDRAERLPPGSEPRVALIEEAGEISSNARLARRAEKLAKADSPRGERIEVRGTWEALAQGVGSSPPCGFPGEVVWFDGDPANGEVLQTWFDIGSDSPGDSEVTISYPVQLGDRRRIVSEAVSLDALPDGARRWVRLALEERRRAERESGRLGRTRIPYEFKGGAGLGGLDFYPRLLPIEGAPGESRLYEDTLDG